MTPELLRVMYSPLDYIHPDHVQIDKELLSPSLKRIINRSLIKRYLLDTKIDFNLQSSDLVTQLVQNWFVIPELAWLLGCKLSRASLAKNGYLATLPKVARQFIELPVLCPALALNEIPTNESIRAHGARYLLLLKDQLPRPLAQRLCLYFAPREYGDSNAIMMNRSLLNFAFHYVKNIKH